MIRFLKRWYLTTIGQFIPSDIFARRYPVSVKTIITNNNEVLFLKTEKGTWDLPGGKLKGKEIPELALVREVKEEINLDVVNSKTRGIHNVLMGNLIKVIVVIFESEVNYIPQNIHISEEHFGYAWIHVSDILTNPNIPDYIKIEFQNQPKQTPQT